MRQRTKDILAGVAVAWLVAMIVTTITAHPAAIVFLGIPVVLTIAFTLFSLWTLFSGRA